MSTKHPKLRKPSDADLRHNPLIGGSKGVVMAQATIDDLADLEGANTFEGDLDNDTNSEGGLEELESRSVRESRRHERGHGPRKAALQGKKTHEEQLRILERKPDVPDGRRVDQNITQTPQGDHVRRPRQNARQSEFPVSRGGMNQESQHNKHNNRTEPGRRLQKARARGE